MATCKQCIYVVCMYIWWRKKVLIAGFFGSSPPQIAREHGIRFLETSAKTNVNIEQAFYNLAEDILKKQLTKDNEETSQNIHVSNTQEKKGGCC